jgi:hypothetical protein
MGLKLTKKNLRKIVLQEIRKLTEFGGDDEPMREPTPEELAAIEAEEADEEDERRAAASSAAIAKGEGEVPASEAEGEVHEFEEAEVLDMFEKMKEMGLI